MRKTLIVELIGGLLIILFAYAAISKLIDYRAFTFQLHKSPLLNGNEHTIAWIIPTVEILAVLLLLFRPTRTTGLFLSFLLMLLFTSYLGFMLLSGQHLPCSCGGILQGLSWRTHFIFNLVFLALSAAGIALQLKQKPQTDDLLNHNPNFENSRTSRKPVE